MGWICPRDKLILYHSFVHSTMGPTSFGVHCSLWDVFPCRSVHLFVVAAVVCVIDCVNDDSGVFVPGLVSLAVGCKHLQVVYLRRCVNVDDDGVIALACNCRQLKDLNLAGCTLVTDASLQALCEHCGQLSSINFSRANVPILICLCALVTDDMLCLIVLSPVE